MALRSFAVVSGSRGLGFDSPDAVFDDGAAELDQANAMAFGLDWPARDQRLRMRSLRALASAQNELRRAELSNRPGPLARVRIVRILARTDGVLLLGKRVQVPPRVF